MGEKNKEGGSCRTLGWGSLGKEGLTEGGKEVRSLEEGFPGEGTAGAKVLGRQCAWHV